ncbi:hypothetical protein GQR58_006666 [Nymphon striatum]|nr:hypothetical protein GQR58_006666 [Nymphon striatum]
MKLHRKLDSSLICTPIWQTVPALLDTYFHGYDLFREKSGFKPQEQEVIFLAISNVNHCEYCVGAHSMIADKMSGVPADVLQAIREGSEIPDTKLAALDAFTRIMVTKAGNPSKEDIADFHEAGYDDNAILGIVLAISVKVISNYSNHLFATPLDDAFSAYSWPE